MDAITARYGRSNCQLPSFSTIADASEASVTPNKYTVTLETGWMMDKVR